LSEVYQMRQQAEELSQISEHQCVHFAAQEWQQPL
jgi:hypothetical protein